MAITGTGTEQDPYIITTYDELVEKAAESGKFVKVGNDINIIEEYPDGDMPALTVNAYIDGNNKAISNWYSTASHNTIVISATSACIYNLEFRNIYVAIGAYNFIQFSADTSDYNFKNCEFSGVINGNFADGAPSNVTKYRFYKCSFNIYHKSGTYTFRRANGIDCYAKFRYTSNGSTIFYTSSWENSYVEISSDDGTLKFSDNYAGTSGFNNCAINALTSSSSAVNGETSLSIINVTHAPNFTAGNNFAALVSDTNWLDVNYLASIGFNAG